MNRLLNKDDAMRLSAAAAKVGISMREAIETFETFCGFIAKAASQVATDEALRKVATGKEWHLMKNAKKHRTRKKYTNRLIKRYYKET